MNFIASPWTAERESRLRSLWADGLSASQISTALGETTRNAVIGKLSRLGLTGRLQPRVKAPRQVSAIRRPSRKQPEFISREEKARRQAARGIARMLGWEMPSFEPETPRPSLHVSLLDLNPDSCRFPEGDGPFLFCGRPRMASSSYCEHCHKITHQSSAGKNTTQHPRLYGWRAA